MTAETPWKVAVPYESGEYVMCLAWVPYPWWRRLLTGCRGEYELRVYRAS